MGERHDTLMRRHPTLFHQCNVCRRVGLRPGILGTKHGDYGMRDVFKSEPELTLNADGTCQGCAQDRQHS